MQPPEAHLGCAQRKIKALQLLKSAWGKGFPGLVKAFQLLLFKEPKSPLKAVKLLPAVPDIGASAKDANGITLKEWKNALEAFSKSQEGAKHLSATKLEGFKTVAPHELDNLDKMANKTLKRLNEQ